MDQLRPIVIKFIYIAAITLIFLTFLLVPSVPILASLGVSVVITLVLFYAGDRFVLPRYGALTASIANFVLSALVYSLARSFITQPLSGGAIFSSAAVIGVAEWFYYRFIQFSPVMGGEIGGDQSPGSDQPQEGGEGQGEDHQEHSEEQQ